MRTGTSPPTPEPRCIVPIVDEQIIEVAVWKQLPTRNELAQMADYFGLNRDRFLAHFGMTPDSDA